MGSPPPPIPLSLSLCLSLSLSLTHTHTHTHTQERGHASLPAQGSSHLAAHSLHAEHSLPESVTSPVPQPNPTAGTR